MSLTHILQDSAYRLTQFKPARIAALEIAIEQDEAAGMAYLAHECNQSVNLGGHVHEI
jgi:hypothetical protein